MWTLHKSMVREHGSCLSVTVFLLLLLLLARCSGAANCNPPHHQYKMEMGSSSSRCNNKMAMRSSNIPKTTEERIVNRPPEKRQRVPSAYNQFIKEEIQRIKANNPDISHREAFSTAAKNWAHFPHIHFGLMLETNNQPKLGHDQGSEKHRMPRAAFLKK